MTATKLTPTQKGKLLRRSKQGASSRELAAEFGINQTTAAKIVRENTAPDSKAIAAAKLQEIIDDESLPHTVRLMAAHALKESLDPQAAPEQPVTPRPRHVPHPSASTLDGEVNLFEGCVEKPVPPPKPKPTPAEQRAKDVERANEMMREAVASGNVSKINALTELFQRQGLALPEPTAPAQVTPTVAPPSEGWLWLTTYRLECAALDSDQRRVDELRAEFVQRGVPIPPHRGYTPPLPDVPVPDRPAAPLPDFGEPPLTNRTITRPAGRRVVDWETFRDSF